MGAMVYHIWKARNRKHFKGVHIQHIEIVNTINGEMTRRILMLKNTKKTSRCSSLWQKKL